MQVAHATDHITHAVIGGKQTINFGISDDPAFFQILSSALYKDPMLAMVRETICNAWDAHIDSNRTHLPLVITLDDDYLTIQDQGKGIPDSLIGPIYGVYGASTKKNDGRQTGGFGLGCKSPFAYTDHFEVTSCHEGTKTIYNMSKSSAQVQGKPSIVPIASFPTTESGITVKIPLNPEKQNYRLYELIKRVVLNGDIFATLNGEVLDTLGLDKSECGLILLNDNLISAWNGLKHFENRIYIRYGNVIYPVENSSEYSALFSKVEGLLRGYYQCKLVMLAPPDSISITPSRESLTLSEITVNTVKDLLTKFLAIFFKNQELMSRHKELVIEYVDAAAKEVAPLYQKLPLGGWEIPGIPDTASATVLKTKEDFAFLEMLLRYSGRRNEINKGVWFTYIKRYMHDISLQGVFDRGLYQTWLRTFQRNLKNMSNPRYYRGSVQLKEMNIATTWWRKHVLAPLVQSMMQVVPKFDRAYLSYIGPNMYWTSHKTKEPLCVKKVFMENHSMNLLHLMNITVVVSHNTNIVAKRLNYANLVDLGCTGSILKNAYFAYEVSRKKGEAETLIKALKSIPNIEVLDLTGRLPNEQAAYEARQEEILKARADAAAGKKVHVPLVKKAKPGLVQFDFILDKQNKRIDTKILANSTDPVRITEPKFVALVSTGEDHRHCGRDLTANSIYAAAMLYGSEGAVTNKTDAYERYLEKGAMDLNEYIVDKIFHDVQNLPSLVQYHSTDPKKAIAYIDEKLSWSKRRKVTDLIKTLVEHPQAHSLIPNFHVLSEEDALRWIIWSELNSNCPHGRRQDMKIVQDAVEAIPLDPELIKFLNQLIANEFLELVDMDELSTTLRATYLDPVATDKILTILKTILN